MINDQINKPNQDYLLKYQVDDMDEEQVPNFQQKVIIKPQNEEMENKYEEKSVQLYQEPTVCAVEGNANPTLQKLNEFTTTLYAG